MVREKCQEEERHTSLLGRTKRKQLTFQKPGCGQPLYKVAAETHKKLNIDTNAFFP